MRQAASTKNVVARQVRMVIRDSKDTIPLYDNGPRSSDFCTRPSHAFTVAWSGGLGKDAVIVDTGKISKIP